MTRAIPWISVLVGVSALLGTDLVIPMTRAQVSSYNNYKPLSRHSSCTNDTSSRLPSCDFDSKGYCNHYVSDSLDPKDGVYWHWGNEVRIDSSVRIDHDWQPTGSGRGGILHPRNNNNGGHFIYLDVANSSATVNSTARITGYMWDKTVKAVCIEFHFATFSDGGKNVPSITLYNRLRNGSDILIGHVQTDTRGEWKIARYFSCVGYGSGISFESEKLSDISLVAIDFISITNSTTRWCDDYEITTIPPTVTTSSTTPAPTPQPEHPNRATGPEASVVISPNTCTEAIDTSTQITCTLGDSDKHKEVYVVDILKDDHQHIAVMRTGSKITFKYDDLAKRFHVDGYLDNNNIKASYLELTLTNPKQEDSGNYTCLISYLNAEGLLEQDRTQASLIVRKLDFGKPESLETAVYSLIHRLEKIEATNKQQLQTIHDLENKMNYRSSFSAFPSQKNNNRRPLGPNMVIIFDTLTSKIGQGYDEKTGVFTAPVSGLYAFHLAIGTWASSSRTYSEVVIDVNNVPKVLLRTNNDRHIGDGNTDQNSLSHVVALKPGDTVKVVTTAGTASSEEIFSYLSSFSGYLVRPF